MSIRSGKDEKVSFGEVVVTNPAGTNFTGIDLQYKSGNGSQSATTSVFQNSDANCYLVNTGNAGSVAPPVPAGASFFRVQCRNTAGVITESLVVSGDGVVSPVVESNEIVIDDLAGDPVGILSGSSTTTVTLNVSSVGVPAADSTFELFCKDSTGAPVLILEATGDVVTIDQNADLVTRNQTIFPALAVGIQNGAFNTTPLPTDNSLLQVFQSPALSGIYQVSIGLNFSATLGTDFIERATVLVQKTSLTLPAVNVAIANTDSSPASTVAESFISVPCLVLLDANYPTFTVSVQGDSTNAGSVTLGRTIQTYAGPSYIQFTRLC
jgi:hypothetical protein